VAEARSVEAACELEAKEGNSWRSAMAPVGIGILLFFWAKPRMGFAQNEARRSASGQNLSPVLPPI
jgi:hypothetical protein